MDDKFEETVMMLAKILKHHEAFLSDWLIRLEEIFKNAASEEGRKISGST